VVSVVLLVVAAPTAGATTVPLLKVWVLSVTTPFPSVVVRVLVSVEDPDSGTNVVDCVVVLVEDDVWATAIPVMRANAAVAARMDRVMSVLLVGSAPRRRGAVGMTGRSSGGEGIATMTTRAQ
jgi:hypothetical protein